MDNTSEKGGPSKKELLTSAGRRIILTGETSVDPAEELIPFAGLKLEEDGFVRQDFVDLTELPVGSFVSWHGEHPSADYLIRKDKKGKIKIWNRSKGGYGFVGKVDDIYAADLNVQPGSKGLRHIVDGVIAEGEGIVMPYFEYEGAFNSGRLIQLDPIENTWSDSIQELYVRLPEENGLTQGNVASRVKNIYRRIKPIQK